MGRVFAREYAPSTLCSCLRTFTFGHVRHLDAAASRFLIALAGLTHLLGARTGPAAVDTDHAGDGAGYALLDVEDTIIEVHGHAKQAAGFGYSGVRGLNALLATITTPTTAPVIVAQRLRKGAAGSPRGAKRLVGDAVKTTQRLLGVSTLVLVRMDSAFYGRGPVHATLTGGAAVSVTVRMDKAVKKTIATIPEDAWTTIEYTDAVFDEVSGKWISRAEVAEIGLTAFSAQKKADHVPGRLVVRRIPDFNADKNRAASQDTLFDVWRFHAFFTTADPAILDTVAADKTHRGHAVIEQVHADLKNSALAHLPSGVFTANAAWLVLAVIAFNLTRAAGTTAAPDLARATTATIRHTLITIPARVATSAQDHPAPAEGMALGDRLDGPIRPGQRPADPPRDLTTSSTAARPKEHRGTPGQRGPANRDTLHRPPRGQPNHPITTTPIGGSRLRTGRVQRGLQIGDLRGERGQGRRDGTGSDVALSGGQGHPHGVDLHDQAQRPCCIGCRGPSGG